jgi:hypothetical protein
VVPGIGRVAEGRVEVAFGAFGRVADAAVDGELDGAQALGVGVVALYLLRLNLTFEHARLFARIRRALHRGLDPSRSHPETHATRDALFKRFALLPSAVSP